MGNRIHVKIGDREIELEGDQKFIEKQLAAFLAQTGSVAATRSGKADLPAQIVQAASTGKSQSPAEFLRSTNPKSGTERLLVLGFYLEKQRAMPDFSRPDINKLAREAKIDDIHAQYFTMAVKQGLIRSVGGSRYSLTLSGEDAALALPKSKSS